LIANKLVLHLENFLFQTNRQLQTTDLDKPKEKMHKKYFLENSLYLKTSGKDPQDQVTNMKIRSNIET